MVGLPWSQHVAFLDDRALTRHDPPRDRRRRSRELGDHPAVLLFALGNEIPPGVVRWHGRVRVERFLRDLYDDAKAASPDSLFTYVNFPPTEFLDLSFFDVCAFNVYLHREAELRAYLARLQHIAGHKPLLLAEAGADSIREGEDGQAAITAMHIRAAFEEGACGAVAFAWTDEWWRGGHAVDDWAFGLVDRERRPKPAARGRRGGVRRRAVLRASAQRTWPRVSVVVCAYNAADTLEDCLRSLERLTYPDYEIILVNDGSTDRTSEIAPPLSRACASSTSPNGGLSAARNVGLAEATGEIVAYTDADTRVDRDWLTYPRPAVPHLGRRRLRRARTSCPPTIRRWRSASRARRAARRTCCSTIASPSTCPAATWRSAATRCSRSAASTRSTSAPATTWTCAGGCRRAAGRSASRRRRSSGITIARRSRRTGGSRSATAKARRWLMAHHPEKFLDGRMLWRGRIYSPLPFVRSLWGTRINAGVWGTAAFPSVYRTDVHPFAFLPHSIRWQVDLVRADDRRRWSSPRPATTRGRRRCCSAPALVGIAATIAKNVAYALRSDVDSLPGSRLWYRAVVAYLHFIQPFARLRGRIRGMLSPPEVALPVARAADQPRAAAVARAKRGARCCCSPAASPRIASGARRGRRPIAC